VLLIERRCGAVDKPGEIIEASVRQSLVALGQSEDWLEEGALVLAGRSTTWSHSAPADVAGMLDPRGHGFIVERAVLERRLIDEARAAGAVVMIGVTRIDVTRATNRWTIAPGKSGGAQAPLLIEATGRGIGVLKSGKRKRLDHLVALMTYVPASPALRDQRLVVETAADGWWYAALLPRRRVVVAYMTDARDLPTTPDARLALWRKRLRATQQIKAWLEGTNLSTMALRAYPADSSIRETLCGPGWVAIGEAAAAYDPLTGSGVVAALTKGAAIARLMTAGQEQQSAIATYADAEREAFAAYAHERRRIYRQAAEHFSEPFWQRFAVGP
jgi:flavin-dependent dehydrogenase